LAVFPSTPLSLVSPHQVAREPLFRRVLNELDALADVPAQSRIARLEQLLLVLVGTRHDVERLLGTVGTQLNGHGEEVAARQLDNLLAAGNAGEVDKRGLDDSLLARDGLDDLFGEAG
jgi:hypothetical protein